MSRETQAVSAFVELTEAMLLGGEIADVLRLLCTKAVALLQVTAAGVMLADEHDDLRAVAASDERTHLMEMFAIQHEEGPCREAYRTGIVQQLPVSAAADRWPKIARLSAAAGYRFLCGIPLRQDTVVLGALNLFRETDEPLPEDDLVLAQALANIVTLTLLMRRETAQARDLAGHLQNALHSRVLIEQAKGALAERLGVSPDEAFERMRGQARDTNTKLLDVAAQIVGSAGPAVRTER